VKRNKTFIIVFLTPAVLSFLIFFFYPILRTIIMSLYKVKGVADKTSLWKYVGFSNYENLFHSQLFLQSLVNIFKIWFIGGIITLFFAAVFAVILTSGVRFKAFWRSLIYLPNIISAVALATMWTQYIFSNQDFGFFKSVLRTLGIGALADIQWTAPQFIFTSMLIAYCFGSVGYFMLILLAGIERIPTDFYEAARMEGASVFVRFFRITLPLIRDVFRTCIVLWSIAALNFFVWAQMFSAYPDPNTITPVYYLYSVVFGSNMSTDANFINVGAGAAVAVILSVLVFAIYGTVNLVIREKKLEY
jgi:ABC-type sugar transport system permease subunit